MKIITEDAAYIQYSDLAYIRYEANGNIPESIYKKYYESDDIKDYNLNDFIKFTDKTEIDFIKGITSIIDFNNIKSLSNSALLEEIEKIIKNTRWIRSRKVSLILESSFSTIDDEYKFKKISDDLDNRMYINNHKIKTIRNYIDYKKRLLKMDFPKEVDCKPDKISRLILNKINKKQS